MVKNGQNLYFIPTGVIGRFGEGDLSPSLVWKAGDKTTTQPPVNFFLNLMFKFIDYDAF